MYSPRLPISFVVTVMMSIGLVLPPGLASAHSSKLDLRAMLLRLDQMPSGWSGKSGGIPHRCTHGTHQRKLPDGVVHVEGAGALFVDFHGSSRPIPETLVMTETLATFEGSAKAVFRTAVRNRANALFYGCNFAKLPKDAVTGHFHPTSFPKYGTQSAAFAAAAHGHHSAAHWFAAIVRVGSVLMAITSYARDSQFQTFVNSAVDDVAIGTVLRPKPSRLDGFPIPSTAQVTKTVKGNSYTVRLGRHLTPDEVNAWYGSLWKRQGTKLGVWTSCVGSTVSWPYGGDLSAQLQWTHDGSALFLTTYRDRTAPVTFHVSVHAATRGCAS